jgi:hypothetical protein
LPRLDSSTFNPLITIEVLGEDVPLLRSIDSHYSLKRAVQIDSAIAPGFTQHFFGHQGIAELGWVNCGRDRLWVFWLTFWHTIRSLSIWEESIEDFKSMFSGRIVPACPLAAIGEGEIVTIAGRAIVTRMLATIRREDFFVVG